MAVDCCKCSAEDYHRSQFWTNLAQLRADNSFCDISININGAIFSAHKVVLSAATEYFNAMFLHGLSEQNSREISLIGLEEETFSVLLDYMYTGDLKLSETNATNVLIASDMLNLVYAVKKCLAYLSRHLTFSNCLQLWNLADRYSFNTLFFEIEKFVNHNFLDIIKMPCFYDIPYSFLMSLACSEEVQIDGEHQILSVVMKWVSHDKELRIERLPELISQVRLPMIAEHVLSAELETVDDTELRQRAASIIESNKGYSPSFMKNNGSSSVELCESFLKFCDFDSWYQRQHIPRKSSRKRILVIGGYSSRGNSDVLSIFGVSEDTESFSCVEMYDTYGAEWEVVASLNQPRSNHCAVRCKNLVYVLGGENELLITDSVEYFNPVENSWKYMHQAMTTPRTAFGAAVIDDTIFALGGWVGTELGTSIECFETRLPGAEWRLIDELPSKRYAFGAVAHEGLIYVVGGLNENSVDLSTVEAYHPASKTWVALPQMNERRSQVAAVVCGPYLYAIGGSNFETGALSSMEKFCFETNEWTMCAPMKFTRAAPAAAVWDNKIFVFCGKLVSAHSTNNITSNTAEVYCPETDDWCMLDRAPTSRGEAVAVII